MAIDVSRIHNLVRTYQRALHHSQEPKQDQATPPNDRVSLSADARQQAERSAARGKKA